MLSRFRVRIPAHAALAFIAVAGCSEGDQSVAKARAVVTEGAGTADLFVHGTLKRNGEPVEGAYLTVQLRPEEEMAEAAVGESIPIWAATRTRTDTDGKFSLRLDAGEVPSKYFGAGRQFLNFELDVIAGKDFALWNTTLSPVGNPQVWRTSDEAIPADAVMDIVMDLGKDKVAVTDSFGQTEKVPFVVTKTPKGFEHGF